MRDVDEYRLRPPHILSNPRRPNDSKTRGGGGGRGRKQINQHAKEAKVPVAFHSCHQNCSLVPQ